jgi:hypothetical protein
MMAFTNTCSGFWKYKNKFAWFEKKNILGCNKREKINKITMQPTVFENMDV